MNEELERLAWQLIDGEASPEDLERIERLQDENPDFRAEVERLRSLSEALAQSKEIAPPPELRPRIDRAVASTSPAWRRPTQVVDMWRPRLVYLAAGLLVGIVVARLLLPVPSHHVDVSDVTGAMHTPAEKPLTAEVISQEGDWGSLSQWRDGNLLMTALDLSDDQPVALVLEAEDGALDLASALHVGGSASELRFDDGRLVVHAADAGRHVVAVSPADGETTVRVLVVSGGEQLANQRVTLRELGMN
jgi:anti-sigma-K factor RskA